MPSEEEWAAMGYTEVIPGHSMRIVPGGQLQSYGRMHVPGIGEVIIPPETLPHSNPDCRCGPCKERTRKFNERWAARKPRPRIIPCPECNTVSPTEGKPSCPDDAGPASSPGPAATRLQAAGPIPWDGESRAIPDVPARQVTTPSGRYYEVGGKRMPSATTVLREFNGPNEGLAAWERRVGKEEAERVRDTAARVGDAAHKAVAATLMGEGEQECMDGLADEHRARLLELLGERCLRIHAVERTVVHPLGIAGTVDLVCDWSTGGGEVRLAVVDYKTKGPRGMHPAALDGYFLQCGIYAQAWKDLAGHTPNHLVVLESAAGAGAARAHEAKLYPDRGGGTLPSGYAMTLGDAPFVKAFIRAREACQKW